MPKSKNEQITIYSYHVYYMTQPVDCQGFGAGRLFQPLFQGADVVTVPVSTFASTNVLPKNEPSYYDFTTNFVAELVTMVYALSWKNGIQKGERGIRNKGRAIPSENASPLD